MLPADDLPPPYEAVGNAYRIAPGGPDFAYDRQQLAYERRVYDWAAAAPQPPGYGEPLPPPPSYCADPAGLEADPEFGAADGAAGGYTPGEDELFRSRLRRKLRVLTVLCFASNLLLLVVGHAGFKRSVGPFVFINIFTLVIFLGGSLVFTLDLQRKTALVCTQLFYVCTWFMVFVGTPIAVYYTVMVKRKVQKHCDKHDGCSDGKFDTLVLLGIITAAIGTAIFFFFFCYLSHVVFMYLAACERAMGVPDARALHPAVRWLARFLPDVVGLWRNLRQGFVFVFVELPLRGFRRIGQCFEDVECISCRRLCEAFCVVACIAIFILAAILCAALPDDSPAKAFWCIIYYILEVFWLVVADSST